MSYLQKRYEHFKRYKDFVAGFNYEVVNLIASRLHCDNDSVYINT